MAKYINNLSAHEYISHRLGITKTAANTLLRVLAEFIAIKILRNEVARVFCIGDFSFITNRIKFSPADGLKKKVRRNIVGKKTYREILKDIQLDLGLDLQEDINIEDDIKDTVALTNRRVKTGITYVRHSLLKYLHRHYCHKASWKHPITKQVHDWRSIDNAVKALKLLHPERYKVLLSIWIGIEPRKELLERWSMSKKQYNIVVDYMLDLLITLIMAPELSEIDLEDM
jgi:hypothetical protein